MLNMLSMYHTDTLRYAMPREIDAFASYGLRQEVMGEYAWTRLQAIKAEQAGHYDEAERLLRLALQKLTTSSRRSNIVGTHWANWAN